MIFKIYQLTASYYLFADSYAFYSEKVLELVAYGLCPVSNEAGTLSVCISEPLAAWAAYSFFKEINRPIEHSILDSMSTTKLSPSSGGLFIEHVLVPSVIKLFTEDGKTLDKV